MIQGPKKASLSLRISLGRRFGLNAAGRAHAIAVRTDALDFDRHVRGLADLTATGRARPLQ